MQKPMHAEVNRCLSAYGNRKNFELTFAPNKQRVFCLHPERCYFGKAPTLQAVGLAYGGESLAAWLTIQLAELAEYCNCREKMSTHQLEECAYSIMRTSAHLKVTEIMLFFSQFKDGVFGRFYGSVDPLIITEALREFRRERNNMYSRHENELRQKQNESAKANAVTYEEYISTLPEEERKKRLSRIQELANIKFSPAKKLQE